jgi:hypothetical protein
VAVFKLNLPRVRPILVICGKCLLSTIQCNTHSPTVALALPLPVSVRAVDEVSGTRVYILLSEFTIQSYPKYGCSSRFLLMKLAERVIHCDSFTHLRFAWSCGETRAFTLLHIHTVVYMQAGSPYIIEESVIVRSPCASTLAVTHPVRQHPRPAAYLTVT